MTESPTNPPTPDIQSQLQHIWDRMKHENDLTNHRLSWLWTTQAILFAAFGVIAKEVRSFGTLPVTVVCLVGILTCGSVGYALWKGHLVLRGLWPSFRALSQLVNQRLGTAPPSEVASDKWAFMHPWRFAPWVLAVAWSLLLGWVYA